MKHDTRRLIYFFQIGFCRSSGKSFFCFVSIGGAGSQALHSSIVHLSLQIKDCKISMTSRYVVQVVLKQMRHIALFSWPQNYEILVCNSIELTKLWDIGLQFNWIDSWTSARYRCVIWVRFKVQALVHQIIRYQGNKKPWRDVRELRASIVLGVSTIWSELSKETVITLKILANFENLHVQLTHFDETQWPSWGQTLTLSIQHPTKLSFPRVFFLGLNHGNHGPVLLARKLGQS